MSAVARAQNGATEGAPAAGELAAAGFAELFAEGWAVGARDPEFFFAHFTRHFHRDVRMIQPMVPTATGHDGFRAAFADVFELVPDLTADVHRSTAEGDELFIEFTLRGTLAGKPVSWDAVDRFCFDGDGLITERVSYFDPLTIAGQVLTNPRAWPAFVRSQLKAVRGR